jgi:hypothetical protein
VLEELHTTQFGLLQIRTGPLLQIGPTHEELIPQAADGRRNAAVVGLAPRGNQPQRRELLVQILGISPNHVAVAAGSDTAALRLRSICST